MLSTHPIDTIVEVSDFDAAREFYLRLGLDVVRDAADAGVMEFGAGSDNRLVIKHTPGRGVDERTCASWRVDDLAAVLDELRGRGITALDYDLPGLRTVNGVADLGFAHLAWIADPSNNVIGLARYRDEDARRGR